jgi:hypothetical protein
MTDVRQASQMGRLVREACDEAATVQCEDACRCGGGKVQWARGTPVVAREDEEGALQRVLGSSYCGR